MKGLSKAKGRWRAAIVFAGIVLAAAETGAAEVRVRMNLNPGWHAHTGDLQGAPWSQERGTSTWDVVSLPHADRLFPSTLHGFREKGRNVTWYRRTLRVRPEWEGKRFLLEFQGAMQDTTLWVNGAEVGHYAVSGYDSFHFDITPQARPGTNTLTVRVDNRPNRDLPPDGTALDYVLFGGLYRDVFLHVTDPVYITFPWEATRAGIRLTLPEVSEGKATLLTECTVRNESSRPMQIAVSTEVLSAEGKLIVMGRTVGFVPQAGEYTFTETCPPIIKPRLWTPSDPYLYKVLTTLWDGDRALDRLETPLGVRWVKFDRAHGFFLNGKPFKLIGANRHQTWPFIGNAVPNGLQRRDAEQLKAMGVNWVRLSHYPQDPDFLDALDELGLMALEEPATWMDELPGPWLENLETSFRRMIRRDRNHPCIIVWGSAINHKPAHVSLVNAALQEDPSRDRGQDTIPTPMDFTAGQVSGGGALSVEHTGHMFPAARGARAWATRVSGTDVVLSGVNREYEQAQRHWEQLNAAYSKPENAGLAVWCFADYNTFHNINEPGQVWHGVVDLFRLPKFSYFWHMSELTSEPMVFIVRVDASRATVFSNCDRVRLFEDRGRGFQEVGLKGPPKNYRTVQGAEIGFALHHPPTTFDISPDAVGLRAEGLVGRSIKATNVWRKPQVPKGLRLEIDRPMIWADGADLSRVIATLVDADGVPIDSASMAVRLTLDGCGQLIGENPLALRAGKGVILVQSGYVPGRLRVGVEASDILGASAEIQTESVPSTVDIPGDLAVSQPSPRRPAEEGRR